MIKKVNYIYFILFFSTLDFVGAHPTGNLTVFRDHVLWSYVYPIEDEDHHACIMIWDKKNEPIPFRISEYEASDWMMYAGEDYLYLLERRYIGSKNLYQARVFKTNLNSQPVEIWPWFDDHWLVGEGGFIMTSDEEMIFCTYPAMYIFEKNDTPQITTLWESPIKKIRSLPGDQLLLISDSTTWYLDSEMNVIHSWEDLLMELNEAPPLNRNQIFDMDYYNGDLLIAYWGKRSFELISFENDRNLLLELNPPFTPHWVAIDHDYMYLFASTIEPGQPITPILLQHHEEKLKLIWKKR